MINDYRKKKHNQSNTFFLCFCLIGSVISNNLVLGSSQMRRPGYSEDRDEWKCYTKRKRVEKDNALLAEMILGR